MDWRTSLWRKLHKEAFFVLFKRKTEKSRKEDGLKSFRIYGSNAYPYNFDDLTELLGVELEEDAETEDKNK